MPNSFAMDINYTCESCGMENTFQPWLVIDVTERPDLLDQVKDQTIHEFACPSCEIPIPLDPPLLLYFPDDEPCFLYASLKQDGAGFLEDLIQGLFTQLVESSGDQELRDQYRDHRAWVVKADLPERLKDFPDTPLKEFDWSNYSALKQLEMLMPDEYLEMVLTTYFGTPDWNKRAYVVDQAPKLLTPAVEPYLERMIAGFKEQGMDLQAQTGRENLEILICARELGFYQAVLEHQARDRD